VSLKTNNKTEVTVMKSLLRVIPIASITLVSVMAISCTKNESGQTASSETTPAAEAPTETAQPASGAPGNAAAPASQSASAGTASRPASGSNAASTRPAGAPVSSAAPSTTSSWGDSANAKSGVTTAPAQPVLKTYTLPVGSTIRVRTTSTLSTKSVEQGAAFAGSLAEPIEVDGTVIAARGANVTGRVVTSDDGGRIKGKAFIEIALTSLQLVNGETVAVETAPFGQEAKSSTKKDAAKVGIASGVGAAIGAIAGGGKGAAIGAGVGAGAGTGAVLATKGEAAVIPAESVISFRTQSSISVKLK
jgi:hypothetical protein